MSDASKQLLTISMSDYLALTGKTGKDFTAVGVEHSLRNRVGSGGTLPSITKLEDRVRQEFLEGLPPGTVAVVSVQKLVQETPSAFFSEGLQFVCYLGTALVLKTE